MKEQTASELNAMILASSNLERKHEQRNRRECGCPDGLPSHSGRVSSSKK